MVIRPRRTYTNGISGLLIITTEMGKRESNRRLLVDIVVDDTMT